MLPGYAANPLNATMEISSLRTNDSGTYHCEVVMGNDYERDTVPLVVSGKCSSLFVRKVWCRSSPKETFKLSRNAADRPSCIDTESFKTPYRLIDFYGWPHLLS